MLVYVAYIAMKQKTGAILAALINAVWSFCVSRVTDNGVSSGQNLVQADAIYKSDRNNACHMVCSFLYLSKDRYWHFEDNN
jgi:hypothetical protein